MSAWPRYPTVFEINTWVWLSELSKRLGASVNLRSVPSAEWDAIASFGFGAVWMMGVWERTPGGIAIAPIDSRRKHVSNPNSGFLER
jgi:hypothetical protein